MNIPVVPPYEKFMNPLLRALNTLGGSGSIEEIYETIVTQENLPDSMLSLAHDPEKSTQTEVAYRLAWARTYLKKFGLLENSSRGVWALTPQGRGAGKIDPSIVVKAVRSMVRQSGSEKLNAVAAVVEEATKQEEWKDQLYRIMTQQLTPAAFERLIQRLLRESGFKQVEVTGRSGDGGIDGRGIARMHGLLSFHVLFQCKRYKGSVGASEIRDFRGAMVGRSDKGLFITTGTFTPASVKEATRDGAPPIDLIDGSDLADRLLELKIGVGTETIEVVRVNEEWFESL